MEYSFYDFLKLIGSLGLFLYGMKIMSEGLQKVAGDRLRSILTAMTTNRVTGVLTGVLITALIQSSSATTVMVVSFVNAGLLTLAESISVIMGANIGTTVTAWIISIFGFKVDMAAFALPLLARPERQPGNACLRTELHGHGILLHHSVLTHRYYIDDDCTGLRRHHGNYIDYVRQRMDQSGTGSSTCFGRKHRNHYHGQSCRTYSQYTG